jgi:lysozyme
MHISSRGLALIEEFEGFSSRPYWDAYGRVWTRGYGETEGIHAGSPSISRSEGQANLKARLERFYEPSIRALGVQFNQHQWDALCSFAWNLGAGIFTGHLRAALQAHEWRRAADLMLQYDHAGGVVLAGLSRRRREEARLFLTPGVTPDPLGALLKPERRLVNTYDRYRRHPRLHRHGLAVTRAAMVRMRKLIWLTVHREVARGVPAGKAWHYRHRGARYSILMSRTRGLG